MTFSFRAHHSFGEFEINAEFSMQTGVTALFGRSGSGKSSILKMIAGLIEPIDGKITLDGRVLFDRKAHKSIAPHRRRIGYVFQEPRLFPHLSVEQNLHYGTWFNGHKNKQHDAERIIYLLGIEKLLKRQPASLSGGEQQRVAIGRALMSTPHMLLMDEPLASLDHQRKAEILPYLEELCETSDLPILYVSHSIEEVMRLADQVALIENGHITSIQPPSALAQQESFLSKLERNEYKSIIQGTIRDFDQSQQLANIDLFGNQLTVPASKAKIGKSVKIAIAPRDVMLATQRPEGLSAMNILPGTITAISHPSTGITNVHLDCGGTPLIAQITATSSRRLGLKPQMPIYAIIKAVTLENY